MCLCVHLDGRKDKMNRGAAAVYLHGISPFKHKHKNNTIKLPWWAICYCNILLSAPAALLCFERTTERKMEIVSLVPSVLPVFPYRPFLSLSSAAKRQSFSLRWWMSDLQWWIHHLLPSGSLSVSVIHMTSLPLTLLGILWRGLQPSAEEHQARPDKGFSKSAWTAMIAVLLTHSTLF